MVVLNVVLGLYVLLCILLYVFQEKLIFFPQPLDQNYNFEFPNRFEELNFKSNDGTRLHGLLFRVDNPKGLVFYLHGNAGSLASWGEVAKSYTELNYDVFLLELHAFFPLKVEIRVLR